MHFKYEENWFYLDQWFFSAIVEYGFWLWWNSFVAGRLCLVELGDRTRSQADAGRFTINEHGPTGMCLERHPDDQELVQDCAVCLWSRTKHVANTRIVERTRRCALPGPVRVEATCLWRFDYGIRCFRRTTKQDCNGSLGDSCLSMLHSAHDCSSVKQLQITVLRWLPVKFETAVVKRWPFHASNYRERTLNTLNTETIINLY